MKTKPKRIPLDYDGVLLKMGDAVESTVGYHAEPHHGRVVEIVRGPCIAIEHVEGCCIPPPNARIPLTTTCAARLWKKSSSV